jgi:hypothetical protein
MSLCCIALITVAQYYGDLVQAALAAASAVLMVISISAYRKRPEPRYLLLMFAFTLLCATSVATTTLEFFAGLGPGMVELMELYLIPSLELLMAVSFLVALLWSSRISRRLALTSMVAAIAVILVVSTVYTEGAIGPSAVVSAPLPAGCTKPAGGFLVVASASGYNDSVGHGAPMKAWPVLVTSAGSNVTITVCNTYSHAVGFQVAHYLQDQLETIQPEQVIRVSFLADQAGTFLMYCSVFSPIHLYLQSGEVSVE